MRRIIPLLLSLVLLMTPAAASADNSYQTPNGPQTVASMATQLRAVGYSGPWDEASVVAAYARTTGSAVRITTGSPASSSDVIILVAGYGSSNAAGPLDSFATLRPRLVAAGLSDSQILEFSYADGFWGSVTGWTPQLYDGAYTGQDLNVSVGYLQHMIRAVHYGQPGASVRVAGFSLGGLVALQELAQSDGADTPDAVLAIASPLNGVNIGAKQAVCDRVALTSVGLGLLLNVGAVGLVGATGAELVCPHGDVMGNLAWIYQHPEFRSQRDMALRSRAAAGTRIAYIQNTADCVYYAAFCSADIGGGDTDDRWTNQTAAATSGWTVDLQRFGWWWNIGKSHSQVMNDPAVVGTAAAFLTS